MSIYTQIDIRFTINGAPIEKISQFSSIIMSGDANSDIQNRLRNAQQTFDQLSTQTKLKIFNTNVKPVLRYICESRKVTQVTSKKL